MNQTYDFEKEFIGGRASWVTEFFHDPIMGNIRLGITHNPGFDKTEKSVEFNGVLSTSSEYIADPEDNYIPTIIGILAEENEMYYKYTITTDCLEFTIVCKHEFNIKI